VDRVDTSYDEFISTESIQEKVKELY